MVTLSLIGKPRQTHEDNNKKLWREGAIHDKHSRRVSLTAAPRHRPRRVRIYSRKRRGKGTDEKLMISLWHEAFNLL